MISVAIAAALTLRGPVYTVTLTRGGTAKNLPIWDVEDTTIDGGAPNSNFGGESILSAGGSRKILIRFGDISRVIAPGQKVLSATLVLTPTAGDKPILKSISAVHGSWEEGPYQTLNSLLVRPKPTTSDKPTRDEGPPAPRGTVTWRQRVAGDGGAAWQQPGAAGPNDSTAIQGAKLSAVGSNVRIEGLGDAVQHMADHPQDNAGFCLAFDAPAEFASSKSPTGRPSLEIETADGPRALGQDVSVISIQRSDGNGKLPTSGSNARYVATVKNVGTVPSLAFTATWSVDGRAGGSQDFPKALAPGEQTTFTNEIPYRPEKADHRLQTIEFRIRPKEGDGNSRNDVRVVTQGAKAISVLLSPKAIETIRAWDVSPEDWVQETATLFNDVYLGQSRYSFAPEGALERIAVQSISSAEPAAAHGASDGSALVAMTEVASTPAEARLQLLRNFALAAGVPDRSGTAIPPSNNALSGRGCLDRFPGLLGYGDTRFEGLIPGSVELSYEPFPSPMIDTFPLEATGLLSASDVAALNATLGGPSQDFPKTTILRAANEFGVPLINLDLTFFQAEGGKVAKDAKPVFTVKTGSGGTVILPPRDGGLFGKVAPSDTNGVLLVKAMSNGVTAWSCLKTWQLLDIASRGNRAAAIADLRFSLPDSPLDPGTNLASDRIVTDSTGALPAKLAALIDGQTSGEVSLGEKEGDWLEIDLGRDRTIGEIALIARPGTFWSKYDLMTYSTGQRPAEALPWTRELDSGWTFANRAEPLADGKAAVLYHGQSRRFRYLRIVNRSGGPGRLAEIKVTPAVVGQ